MGSLKSLLNNGPLLAAALTILLLLWMLSGLLTTDSETPPQPAHSGSSDKQVTVQVRRQQAEMRERAILMQGQTEPGRKATLRAEIEGAVRKRPLQKGTRVAAGELIMQIDLGSLPRQRDQAAALIRQRELEHEGSRRLRQKGHLAEAQLAERTAQLAAARAELSRIDELLDSAELRAPFAGRLDQLPVELGDYVRKGDLLATVLDYEPWLVAGHVAEHEVPLLNVGGAAQVELTTGQKMSGRVRYIASEGDTRTRTFRVEIEINTPLKPPVAGMTAGVRLPLAEVAAHLISPALLTLDASGQLGVHIVTETSQVSFRTVTMIEAGPHGIWVTGLPEQADVITVGAGYVSDGDQVQVVYAQQESAQMAPQMKGRASAQ